MGRPRKDNLRTTPKVKVRVKKQRTFTGCDTCRKLKIKCDGRRPAPCLRCEKSHRTCLGYDLKLKFSKPVVLSKDGSLETLRSAYDDGSDGPGSRTFIPFVQFPSDMSYSSFVEMDEVLEKLEEEKFSGEPIVSGPFTVFSHSWIDTGSSSNEDESNKTSENAQENIDDEALISQQRHKTIASNRKNLSTLLKYSLNDGVSFSGLQTRVPKRTKANTEASFNQNVWIHPSLKPDALITYKIKLGNANVTASDWQKIKHVLFEEHYGFSDHLNHRIVDKFTKDEEILNHISHERLKETILILNNMATKFDMASLLATGGCQNLIRSFPSVAQKMFFLSFSNDISHSILLPSFYRIAGEMLLSDSAFFFSEDKALDKFSKLIKETLALEALALTSLEKFKCIFQRSKESSEYFKCLQCFINFREITLINMSRIFSTLIGEYTETETVKIQDKEILNGVISSGLLKELLFTIHLALSIDENVNIVQNYKILHEVSKGICDYVGISGFASDRETENILLWSKYRHAFFKSTSTIDIQNYVIDEEGYEDLDENYNLISTFKFDDALDSTEQRRIQIQSSNIDDPISDNEVDENDNEVEAGSETESEVETEETVELPSRLAFRPLIEDKPPRRFTVRFSYDEEDEDEDDEELGDGVAATSPNFSSDENDTTNEDANPRTSLDNEFVNVSEKNDSQKAGKVDSLTGLSTTTKPMSIQKREQLNKGKLTHLVDIKFPLNSNDNDINTLEISSGIPISLLQLIERTVLLADHRNCFIRKKIFPRNFPKFCCDLEEDLVNWGLPWNLYHSGNGNELSLNNNGEVVGSAMQFHSPMHKVLYHSVICHYNCVLLYFYRLVKDTDPSLLQGHVISTLNHLESLYTLSLEASDQKNSQYSIRPPFWCFLIAASDAVNTDVQLRFDRLTKLWFEPGEKWVGKQMVYECYRTRNMEANGLPGVDYDGVSLSDEDDPNGHSTVNRDEDDSEKEISWLDIVKGWQLAGYN